MKLLVDKNEIAEFVENQRKKGKTIGFVPTMGALHQGHVSLVERSRRENDITIVSIFVNPTQFDQKEDLVNYPRTEDADAARLKQVGCDLLYLPTVQDIYPLGAQVTNHWDFGSLEEGMEGSHRPGHFAGVAQVVFLLLKITNPHHLYLGQKDYQQYAILRRLVELEAMELEVRICPIIREPDGLAMSSRNVRLSAEIRKEAVVLSQSLFRARDLAQEMEPDEIRARIIRDLEDNPNVDLEYFEIADPDTLEPISVWDEKRRAVICLAAWMGGVRLIDNVLT